MKFEFSRSLALLSVAASSMAYSLQGYSLFINGLDAVTFEEYDHQVHSATLESPKDVFALALRIDATDVPHQIMYLLSDGNGLDFPVFPPYYEPDHLVKQKITVESIPNALKAQDKFYITLVVASDNDEEENIEERLLEINFSDAFREAYESEEHSRLGAKPEIHHIFNTDQATVNPIVPIVFSLIAGALLFALFGSWTTYLSGSLLGNFEQANVKTLFLVVLASFEVTFVRYYLGATIFTTIFHVAILAVPALIIGSKALRLLAQLRAATPTASK